MGLAQPGNYFADASTMLAAKGSARAYNDSTQVAHSGNVPGLRPMRSELRAFVVTRDICVAKGTARANEHLGDGGGTQYFVMDQDKSALVGGPILKFGK